MGFPKMQGPDMPCCYCPKPITIGDRMEFVREPEGGLVMAHQECNEKAYAEEAKQAP